MKTISTLSRAAVGAALLAAAGMSTAMVVNGSFEAGVNPPPVNTWNSLPVGNTDMTGWTVNVASIAWIHGPISAGIGMLSAQAGNYFLDLTDTRFSGPYGGVSQTIATTANDFYTLKFWLGTSQYYNPATGASALVSIAGNSVVLSSTVTTLPNSWEEKTVTFQASGSSTMVTFLGSAGQDYIGLDNVSVTAVPEPGSITMLLAGLVAVGAVVKRRRSTQA